MPLYLCYIHMPVSQCFSEGAVELLDLLIYLWRVCSSMNMMNPSVYTPPTDESLPMQVLLLLRLSIAALP